MDADIDALVRAERLAEAAALAIARGAHADASRIFERACDFRRAAEAALTAGDAARALPLALDAKDAALVEASTKRLLSQKDAAERVAFQLERRGDHVTAGELYEGLGKRALAAQSFERGGAAVRAARAFEAEGDVVAAARALESAARKEAGRGDVLVALGALLLRHGKAEPAVRALQKVPRDAPERRAALTFLLDALARLGLARAHAEASGELAALGGPVVTPAPEDQAAPLAAVRARIFGRYEILREVASSPSARVLECHDTVRGDRVAVKVFAGWDARGSGRDALARFEREVRALGSLDHPNVVPLEDYLPEGPALVLAWMSGGSLEDRLKREVLTPARSVEIARAVLAALAEAHRLGILHRDVKPANVLFDDAGVTRLSDFGVAHLGDASHTATAGVIGTRGYMSPEQRAGRPAGASSDVYGVGAVLWEMLTGERPGEQLGVDAAVRPSALHRELDARHDAVLLSMLAPLPADRPEDALAARRALAALRWPDTVERAAPSRRPEGPASARPGELRLVRADDGSLRDAWIGRGVVLLPIAETTLARAAAFANADDPALQAVLRVDRQAGTLWLEAPRGTALEGRLSASARVALGRALERLHASGSAHGAVDAAHVVIDTEGHPTLLFPAVEAPHATPDLDRLALAALARDAEPES